MGAASAEQVEVLAAVWAGHTGSTSQQFFDLFAGAREVHALAAYPVQVLRTSAATATTTRLGTAVDRRLPLARWLRAARAAGGDVPASGTDANAARVSALLARYTGPVVVDDFAPGDVARALVVLRERHFDAVRYARTIRRAPRWVTAPSRSLVGAPVLVADEVEVAIVALLSATSGQWQFSSTGNGRMFTHPGFGWAKREEDRTYVTGLSDIVDATSGLIESHRGGAGGRVQITRRWVVCAGCGAAMAGIGDPVVGPTAAFGVCRDVT